MTRKKLLEKAYTVFREGNIDEWKTEAELLACFCFDCSRLSLKLMDAEVDKSAEEHFDNLLKDRLTGRPLQYVIGRAPFMDMDLFVDERVLIPRPETEELAALAQSFITGKARSLSSSADNAIYALDICTGSGAIALAMASCADRVENLKVTASDISPEALSVAKLNSERLNLPIELLQGDLFSPVWGRYFHIITANPPYIPRMTILNLQSEVRNFEPELALDGGTDGLDIIRTIASQISAHLLPGGLFLMEIGDDQGDACRKLFPGCTIIRDINGQDRIVRWQRP